MPRPRSGEDTSPFWVDEMICATLPREALPIPRYMMAERARAAQEEFERMQAEMRENERLPWGRVNVGGTLFSARIDKWTRFEGSYFAKLFSEGWEKRLPEPFFIDRSPKYFPRILQYLNEYPNVRISQLYNVMAKSERPYLKAELDFYLLSPPSPLPLRWLRCFPEEYQRCWKKVKLLYRWSDEMDQGVERLHELCDGKGPTICIATLPDYGYVGAYTSMSMSSDHVAYADDTVFHFRIGPPGTDSFVLTYASLYPSHKTVYMARDSAPSFGTIPMWADPAPGSNFPKGPFWCYQKMVRINYQPMPDRRALSPSQPHVNGFVLDLEVWSVS